MHSDNRNLTPPTVKAGLDLLLIGHVHDLNQWRRSPCMPQKKKKLGNHTRGAQAASMKENLQGQHRGLCRRPDAAWPRCGRRAPPGTRLWRSVALAGPVVHQSPGRLPLQIAAQCQAQCRCWPLSQAQLCPQACPSSKSSLVQCQCGRQREKKNRTTEKRTLICSVGALPSTRRTSFSFFSFFLSLCACGRVCASPFAAVFALLFGLLRGWAIC